MRQKFGSRSRTSGGLRLWWCRPRELSLPKNWCTHTRAWQPIRAQTSSRGRRSSLSRLPGRTFASDCANRAKTLLPEIRESDLQLGYSGLRPKLVPPDHQGIVDFVITRDPAVPQAIHLVGMESPGLTAAPSVGQHVRQLVAEVLG